MYAEVLPDLDNIIITRQEEANITCILTDDQGKCSGIGGWTINAGKVISPENPIQNGSFWTIKKPNSGYEETFIIIDGEKAPSQVKLQCIINGCAKYNKTIFVQGNCYGVLYYMPAWAVKKNFHYRKAGEDQL